MRNLVILNSITLIKALLESGKSLLSTMSKDDPKRKEVKEEVANAEITLFDLKSELVKFEEGELVEIENGEAHVLGFYETNENDYGPHPLRYVEISGLIMGYKEMAKRVEEDGTFVELEAEYTQSPYDGDSVTDKETALWYAADRDSFKKVSFDEFIGGKLEDGEYFVYSD